MKWKKSQFGGRNKKVVGQATMRDHWAQKWASQTVRGTETAAGFCLPFLLSFLITTNGTFRHKTRRLSARWHCPQTLRGNQCINTCTGHLSCEVRKTETHFSPRVPLLLDISLGYLATAAQPERLIVSPLSAKSS